MYLSLARFVLQGSTLFLPDFVVVMAGADESQTLDSISHTLLQGTRLVHAPKKPQNEKFTAVIADMHLHPTLESLLHILNHDLPSAHFLVRHMQAPPAIEGMLLHGILHRAEGDFNNARAWIGDVKDACEGWQPKKRDDGEKLDDEVARQIQGAQGIDSSLISYVYKKEDATKLIDDVESFRQKKQGQRSDEEETEIEQRIREESERVLEWCRAKFGSREMVDASEAWVKNSEEISKISGDMVTGGKGHRKF